MDAQQIAADLTKWADQIDNRLGPISGRDADTLALVLRRIGGEVRSLDADPSKREIIYLRTIGVLRKLIADLSDTLTDEGPGDWTEDGLYNLRCRVANALPAPECPDWLNQYRDPAMVKS